MNAYRSHTCNDLRAADVGAEVRLSGWVHRVRDHGGVLFIDLRDHYGITQVIADSDSPAFADLDRARAEWVIRIDGRVKARSVGLVNPKIATGEIEVYATAMTVLGEAADLPLPVFGDTEYPEETRLSPRTLRSRRPPGLMSITRGESGRLKATLTSHRKDTRAIQPTESS